MNKKWRKKVNQIKDSMINCSLIGAFDFDRLLINPLIKIDNYLWIYLRAWCLILVNVLESECIVLFSYLWISVNNLNRAR
mgnify:CR=1 FL=1